MLCLFTLVVPLVWVVNILVLSLLGSGGLASYVAALSGSPKLASAIWVVLT